MTFPESGEVSGFHYGTIHDEEAAYFAAFDITLSSAVAGPDNSYTFDSLIEVDGDTQTEQVTWTLTETKASTRLTELDAAECDGLMNRVHPPIE